MRFHVLGWTDLELPGNEAAGRDLIKQQKRLALLAYLVVERRPRHRRDVLADLFWPDLDQRHARRALNQALYVVRGALGSDVLASFGSEEVSLAPGGIWCDATAFRTAVQQRDFAAAMELYRGHLLEGFHLAGEAPFQAWLDGTRQALRAQAGRAAAALASMRLGVGDIEAAVAWCDRAASLVPTDESLIGSLADALVAAGESGAVASLLERHGDRLGREYELPLGPRLGRLRDDLKARRRGAAPVAQPGSGGADDPLVVAKFLLGRRNRWGVRRAIALLEQAAAGANGRWTLLPLLGQAYLLLPWYDPSGSIDVAGRAGDVITQALQLQPPNAESYANLAVFEAWHVGDARRAHEAFRHAFDLDAHSVSTHHWHALVCAAGRDFETAIEAIDRARALGPASSIIETDRATILFWARRFADAVGEFETILAVDSAFEPALQRAWRVFALAGHHDRAGEVLLAWLRLRGGPSALVDGLTEAFVGGGWGGVVELLRADHRAERAGWWGVSPASEALAWATLGDRARAARALESARRRQDPTLPLLLIDPALDELRAAGAVP